jgi:hypothetical protein
MREFMPQFLPTTFRHFVTLTALASAFAWSEQSAIGQGINVGYAGGPAIRGTSMAMPLPPGNPNFGGPMQAGRMIHPSASPLPFSVGHIE